MEFKLPNYNLYIAYSAYVTLGENILCALREYDNNNLTCKAVLNAINSEASILNVASAKEEYNDLDTEEEILHKCRRNKDLCEYRKYIEQAKEDYTKAISDSVTLTVDVITERFAPIVNGRKEDLLNYTVRRRLQ